MSSSQQNVSHTPSREELVAADVVKYLSEPRSIRPDSLPRPEIIQHNPSGAIAVSGIAKFTRVFSREGRKQRLREKADRLQHRNSVVRYAAEGIDPFTDDGDRADTPNTNKHKFVTASTPAARWQELQYFQFGTTKIKAPGNNTSAPEVSIWKDHWAIPEDKREPDLKGINPYRPTTPSEIAAVLELEKLNNKKTVLRHKSVDLQKMVDIVEKLPTRSKSEEKYLKQKRKAVARAERRVSKVQKKFEKIAAGKDRAGFITRKRAERLRRKAR